VFGFGGTANGVVGDMGGLRPRRVDGGPLPTLAVVATGIPLDSIFGPGWRQAFTRGDPKTAEVAIHRSSR
jgi:hypothetical protein